MWRWCTWLSGVLLIAAALVALPSGMIVPSYVGGSAVHGSVDNGRYFVNPVHNQPIVEVSASTWRTVYWVERLWPWSVLILCWGGMFLLASGQEPQETPLSLPPKALPPKMLWACAASAVFTVAGTWLCRIVVRTPWVVMLVGCILLYVSGGLVVWFCLRSLRRQSSAEPVATSDSAQNAPGPSCTEQGQDS